MFFEEIVIGFEYRKFLYVRNDIRLATNKNHMSKYIKYIMSSIEVRTIVFECNWLNRLESKECSSLELN
jgi:hypothetical protein